MFLALLVSIGGTVNTYILLDVLLSSIAEYFYESKYKQRVKILSDTIHQNVLKEIYYPTRQIVMSVPANFADIYLRGTRGKYAKRNGFGAGNPVNLRILDIFQVNTFQTAKFMYRYHNNLLPSLFLNLFNTSTQIHSYSTRTANNYRVHHCRTNLKKFTILYQGPKFWNSLPVTITSMSSFPNFKKKLLDLLVK